MREASTAASQNLNDATVSTKYATKKPDRPLINAGIDDREWSLFIDTWTRYKRMCNLSAANVETLRLELRASCSNEVNKLLFEYIGANVLDECSEKQLLDHIKIVAVKSVHKEVHRRAFNSMIQDEGETVTKFAARLKAKAFLCSYKIPCTCCETPVMQSYADEEISQRLIAGLRNQEHQRKLLSEASELTTLQKKIDRLHVLEMTDESAFSLHTPAPASDAALGKSRYKNKKSNTDSAVKCRFCGQTSHPGGKSLERSNCPARGKICYKCNIKGHVAIACNKSKDKDNASATQSNDEEVPASDASLTRSIPPESDFSFSFSAQQQNLDFRMAPHHGKVP